MSKNKTAFKLPKKKQPFFAIVKLFIRPFYRRPELISECERVEERAIFVSNHCAKRGAVIMELYLPVRNAKWGAHEMLGNYRSRRAYLRDVFYIKKKGFGKFRSSFLATFDAFFSIFFYRGMKFLPTYTDARFASTLNDSVEVLKDGTAVLVFPEDSDEGYKDVMEKFFPGFVMLADNYYRKTKTDLPVYPVYYSQSANRLIIGKPEYLHSLKEQGLDRNAVAELFKDKVNALYYGYVAKN
ncbi:MAG: hypothetical protein ACI4L9_06940 [Candidatus Coproplasma sp.]